MQETPVPFLGWVDPLEKGYPLQYSWASLVAQTVKNPPAVQEIWAQSQCQEDPHSSIFAWRIPWTERLVGYSPRGCKELDMTERLSTYKFSFN